MINFLERLYVVEKNRPLDLETASEAADSLATTKIESAPNISRDSTPFDCLQESQLMSQKEAYERMYLDVDFPRVT